MTSYPAATHDAAIRRPRTPPPRTAMGRDEVEGGVHWGSVVVEAGRVCWWEAMVERDNDVVRGLVKLVLRLECDFVVVIGPCIHCEDAYRMVEGLADILRTVFGSRRAQRDILLRRCSSSSEVFVLWSLVSLRHHVFERLYVWLGYD
jgi:hypothetical protein